MDLGKLLGGALDADALKDVIELVTKNKDVLTNLPSVVATLATGLTEAGEQARAAGIALSGADGKSGAMTRLSGSASTLGSIADNLASVTKLIDGAVDDISKVPLMGAPAKQLSTATKTIHGTTTGLGGLADDLVALADILGQVGNALTKLGDKLDGSGSDAKGLFGK